MNRDRNDYLVPLLLAKGSLPIVRLIYHATGEIFPGGVAPADIQQDLDELDREGLVRMESRHNPHHRRVEKTVFLTRNGYDACEKVLDAGRYKEFERKEAGLDSIDAPAKAL